MACRAALAGSLAGFTSLLFSAQAKHGQDPPGPSATLADRLTLSGIAVPDEAGINSPTTRLAAVRSLVAERLSADPGVRDLLACALAGRAGNLSVVVNGDSGVISLSDLESVSRVARVLEAAHAEHGGPLVGVEPLRPTSIDDRAACDRLMSFLNEVGIRSVDAARVRMDRRNRADAAVEGGLDATEAREAVDELDLDFVIRTSLSVSDLAESLPYQVPVASVEAAVTMSITRLGSREAVELAPILATARSLTRQSAEWQAKERALGDAAAAGATQIANEWVACLDGSSPWLLELTGAADERLMGVQIAHPGLKVREHRPGVRSLLEGPAQDIDAAARTARGEIEQSRPGYIRTRCKAELSNLALWTAGVAIGLGTVAAALWATRRRDRPRPRADLTGR